MLNLLYICQLADPQVHDLDVYTGQQDGEDDARWFEARLEEMEVEGPLTVTTTRVCLGEPIPDEAGFDAAVVGGSYHMVGEDLPWQRAVLEWLDRAHEARLPVLGICGGHQLMASLHGAPVVALEEGTWGATLAVERTPHGRDHWLFRDVAPSVGFHFGNTEHVASPPAGARVLARRATSPALALDYGRDWVSVQFHPEMTVEAFARSWGAEAAQRMPLYEESPTAPRLLRNFVQRVAARGPRPG